MRVMSLPSEKDGALVRLLQAGDDAEKGGFAAAGGSEQDHEFPVAGFERDAAEGFLDAESFADVFDAEAHDGDSS